MIPIIAFHLKSQIISVSLLFLLRVNYQGTPRHKHIYFFISVSIYSFNQLFIRSYNNVKRMLIQFIKIVCKIRNNKKTMYLIELNHPKNAPVERAAATGAGMAPIAVTTPVVTIIPRLVIIAPMPIILLPLSTSLGFVSVIAFAAAASTPPAAIIPSPNLAIETPITPISAPSAASVTTSAILY